MSKRQVLIFISLFVAITGFLLYRPYPNIPSELEKHLIEKGYDYNNDGYVSNAELQQIIEVNLSNVRIWSTKGIDKMVHLQKLHLVRNKLTSIEEVGQLEELKVLDVSKIEDLDYTPLNKCRGLKTFRAMLSGIETIEELPDLELVELILSGNELTTLDGIDDYNQLRVLYCDSNAITDISAVTHLHHLEILDLRSNPVQDFGPIKELTKLEELYVDHQQYEQLKKAGLVDVLSAEVIVD